MAIERFRIRARPCAGRARLSDALARAMLAAGRADEARQVLDDVLRRDATDGEANLIMARVLYELGAPAEAISHYHRAVYGRWRQGGAAHRVQARLELVEVLARQSSSEELLAELLPLQESSHDLGDRTADRTPVPGRRGAGSCTRLVAADSGNCSERPRGVCAGSVTPNWLGAITGAARAGFQAALQLTPHDLRLRERLALCEDVLALDPTSRGLSSTERYARSVTLVGLAQGSLERCAPTGRSAADVSIITPARSGGAAARDQATEGNLALAERLWHTHGPRCQEVDSGTEERLGLVLNRTAQ